MLAANLKVVSEISIPIFFLHLCVRVAPPAPAWRWTAGATMNRTFRGPIAGEPVTSSCSREVSILIWTREYTLHEFDRFLIGFARENPAWQIIARGYRLAGEQARKETGERLHGCRRPPAVVHVSSTTPSSQGGGATLAIASNRISFRAAPPDGERLSGLAFRSSLYRALVLILYCTGIRFGEALRLRLRDVDTRNGVLFIETFKGRARWVPFHRTLLRELTVTCEREVRSSISLTHGHSLWVPPIGVSCR